MLNTHTHIHARARAHTHTHTHIPSSTHDRVRTKKAEHAWEEMMNNHRGKQTTVNSVSVTAMLVQPNRLTPCGNDISKFDPDVTQTTINSILV